MRSGARAFSSSKLDAVVGRMKRSRRASPSSRLPLEAQLNVLANRVSEAVRFDLLWKKAHVGMEEFKPETREEVRQQMMDKVLEEENKAYGSEAPSYGPRQAPKQYDDALTKVLYGRGLRSAQFRSYYNNGAVNETLVDGVWKKLPKDVQKVLSDQPEGATSSAKQSLEMPHLKRESVLERMAGAEAVED